MSHPLTQYQPTEAQLEVDESRNVINLVPPNVRMRILDAMEKAPNYFNKSEMELWNIVRPSDTADGIRIAFWHEYNRVQDAGKNQMIMHNVYGGFMHSPNFYKDFLPKAANIAWMLNIPTHYLMSLEAHLQHGKNTLGKIIRVNLFEKDGSLKIKEAQIFLKAYEMLDNRVKGSVVQRIESKSAHLNVTQRLDADEIKKEIEALTAANIPITITE